ncbi:radical SAM family heme chaperone HemW [Polycyclovorans algicola]|uniref:radical SAM family heme chaperone HemW n=1 Tax=Polycyclovorans algicola TaxID=616992 RepID=UPI000B2BCA5F|nr:radical SAM family heme chaperone HemW [Polycyclovorans algicola]
MNSAPLALYLHFPWCVRKCPYCDFNSHTLRGEVPEADYVAALLRDLDADLLSLGDQVRPVTSAFLGGGTPSLFSGAALQQVLDGVRARVGFVDDAEITLEANPGTVDEAHFAGYRAAGINRLSIGVQSFNPAHLKRLGRIHGADDALRAMRVARAAGFDNVNLDLMFGLPDQIANEALADLAQAVALSPEHLSVYQLTLEPNTEFAARPPPLPDDDRVADMQIALQARLADAGYAQYEVSAYAQSGRQSRHNLTYWAFGDYLGVGAGAHGKFTLAGQVQRRAKHKHPKTYLATAGAPSAWQENRVVPPAELPFEFAMNALRLVDGFTPMQFEHATGLPMTVLDDALDKARAQGLINEEGGRLRASPLGYRHLNRLMGLFL